MEDWLDVLSMLIIKQLDQLKFGYLTLYNYLVLSKATLCYPLGKFDSGIEVNCEQIKRD